MVLTLLVAAGCNVRITHGDGHSENPAISGDGRLVAFQSAASDLVPDDTNGYTDIFVWDATTRATVRITDGNGHSHEPVVSDDGRYVAFWSTASDLVPDDTNGDVADVFRWDSVTGSITDRISLGALTASKGRLSISGDGRYVAFTSYRTNGLNAYLWDATTGGVTAIVGGAFSVHPAISTDGGHVAFASLGADSIAQVYVQDTASGAITSVTQGNGDSDWPSVSDDGRYVTFRSEASDLVPDDTNGVADVFVWDATSGTTTRVTDGDDSSERPVISGDGRYVALQSYASDLVPGDANGTLDVFVWDAVTGAFTRATPNADSFSQVPTISADGRYVTYHSAATNLGVGDDTNGMLDVFRWDQLHGAQPAG